MTASPPSLSAADAELSPVVPNMEASDETWAAYYKLEMMWQRKRADRAATRIEELAREMELLRDLLNDFVEPARIIGRQDDSYGAIILDINVPVFEKTFDEARRICALTPPAAPARTDERGEG